MTKLTLAEIVEINEECNAEMSDKDVIATLASCNLYAETGELMQGKKTATAAEWAKFFAEQIAAEQNAEAKAYAKFHSDAYGDD